MRFSYNPSNIGVPKVLQSTALNLWMRINTMCFVPNPQLVGQGVSPANTVISEYLFGRLQTLANFKCCFAIVHVFDTFSRVIACELLPAEHDSEGVIQWSHRITKIFLYVKWAKTRAVVRRRPTRFYINMYDLCERCRHARYSIYPWFDTLWRR